MHTIYINRMRKMGWQCAFRLHFDIRCNSIEKRKWIVGVTLNWFADSNSFLLTVNTLGNFRTELRKNDRNVYLWYRRNIDKRINALAYMYIGMHIEHSCRVYHFTINVFPQTDIYKQTPGPISISSLHVLLGLANYSFEKRYTLLCTVRLPLGARTTVKIINIPKIQ